MYKGFHIIFHYSHMQYKTFIFQKDYFKNICIFCCVLKVLTLPYMTFCIPGSGLFLACSSVFFSVNKCNIAWNFLFEDIFIHKHFHPSYQIKKNNREDKSFSCLLGLFIHGFA